MTNTYAKSKNALRLSTSEKIGITANVIFLSLLTCAFIIPFLYVISVSMTSESALANYGSTLIPREFSSSAYQFLMKYSDRILISYMNTIIIGVATTILMILVTSTFAFAVSKTDLPGRTGIMMYVLFSMLFGGGLIPFYLAMNWYGFSGSWLALIVPGCFSSWNMILMRNFFSTLPASLEESALVEGAGYFTILFRIMLPLSKPIIATLSLFCIVGTWNNWYSSLLFLSNKPDLWPIMMFLKVVLEAVNPANMIGLRIGEAFPPTECLKMAAVVVCVAPILVSYPFFQKYFVKGIMIGSVKG